MKETVRRHWRALGFVALSGVCLSVATGYVLHSRARAVTQAGAVPAAAPPESVAATQALPHVMFRNLTSAAEAGFVAVAPLSAPDGPRQITDYSCLRLYMAAGQGLCLAEEPAEFGAPYKARFFGPAFETVRELPLQGVPSRARVSPDGKLGASTVFVNGDSYAAGAFSTRTTLYDMAAGTSLGDLETFGVFKDGKRIQGVDFNFWGVTFDPADSRRFYATLGTGGHTYLVAGDVASRTAEVLRDGVECPSLSPDGTRIAFKQRVSGGGLSEVKWQLAVLAIDRPNEDHPLAETRNVDDQAEWLDDGTVLYSVASDTYAVAADGSGAPRLFAQRAQSPVARPGSGS